MLDRIEVGTIGLVILLCILLVLNARFLRRWILVLRHKGNLRDQPTPLAGGAGLIYIGVIFVSVRVIEVLLEGREWYLGLLPIGWGLSGMSWEPLFAMFGYVLIAIGLKSIWNAKRSASIDESCVESSESSGPSNSKEF